jgi:hypothetical protein
MSTVSSMERVCFHYGLAVDILSHLQWNEIIGIEVLNVPFRVQIRCCDPLWRAAAKALFQGKEYIPDICRSLIVDGSRGNHRADLRNMSVKELRLLAAKYGLSTAKCFEKDDIIALINNRELRKKLPDECLARFAVRIAYIDRKRNILTEDELCSFDWNIRVKEDGPLGYLAHNDPWWSPELLHGAAPAPTTTIINFYKDGSLKFHLNGPSPFEMLRNEGAQEAVNSYSLSTYSLPPHVYLSFGVKEYIARHPTNWGFVLQSPGSVWTSFRMPARNDDPALEDGTVESLVNFDRRLDGFEL